MNMKITEIKNMKPNTPNEIDQMYNIVHAVKVNQDTIEKLNETNSKYLQNIALSYLRTGNDIINNSSQIELAYLNNLVMVPWNQKEFDKAYNIINYLKINPDRLYFITKKSITEVYFTDTLPVEKYYNLIANTDEAFTIELIFKSARVRNVDQFIYGNKYRFNWSKLNNKMTVRKLTDKE